MATFVMVSFFVDPVRALIVSEVTDETDSVATLKLALACPAETTKVVGTVATAVLLLARVTVTEFPVARIPLKTTVPITADPPVTASGVRVNEFSTGESMDRVVDLLDPLVLAVILAVVFVPTGVVVTANVCDLFPGETTMVVVVGVAAGLLLLRLIETPPTGAALLRVTVPVVV
jgi:hypothetical protein